MCMTVHTSDSWVIPLGQLKSKFWVGPTYLYKIFLMPRVGGKWSEHGNTPIMLNEGVLYNDLETDVT